MDGSCDQFSHCTDGQHTLIRCPPGIIFSPEVGTCVHPDQTNRPNCAANGQYQHSLKAALMMVRRRAEMDGAHKGRSPKRRRPQKVKGGKGSKKGAKKSKKGAKKVAKQKRTKWPKNPRKLRRIILKKFRAISKQFLRDPRQFADKNGSARSLAALAAPPTGRKLSRRPKLIE